MCFQYSLVSPRSHRAASYPKEVLTPGVSRGSGVWSGVRLVRERERGHAALSSPHPCCYNTFNLEEKQLRPRLDYGVGEGGLTNGKWRRAGLS